MSIGERIQARRIELGMTQEELAEKMGYTSRSSINKIEKGINDVSQKKIMKFAEVLAIAPEALVDDNADQEKIVFNLPQKDGMSFADRVFIDMCREIIDEYTGNPSKYRTEKAIQKLKNRQAIKNILYQIDGLKEVDITQLTDMIEAFQIKNITEEIEKMKDEHEKRTGKKKLTAVFRPQNSNQPHKLRRHDNDENIES